jgi:hypothetical protein
MPIILTAGEFLAAAVQRASIDRQHQVSGAGRRSSTSATGLWSTLPPTEQMGAAASLLRYVNLPLLKGAGVIAAGDVTGTVRHAL